MNKFYHLTILIFLILSSCFFSNWLLAKQHKSTVHQKLLYKKIYIHTCLYEDAIHQHLPIKILNNLINLFSWDIDFSNEVHKGDSIEVLYQTNKPSHILATRFISKKHTYTIIQFKHQYYNVNGLNIRKAFIRSPVKYTRISSKFTCNRVHPILHRIRAHKGVDYAAPPGTPVKACGDGKIIFVGWQHGYGNTVILRHGIKYTTLYGHLSRFVKTLKTGERVKQGQVIAYVGSSGLATGPHLHFEFRIFGKHQDPLTVKLPTSQKIKLACKKSFKLAASNLLTQLDKASHH